ncbi:MAG: type IV toxin-antitoxin system AbiEi family antitoxin domain-containing protein [Candidatus Kariarchaeaceae archaeon]|jgi:predicted transcriptional regulator of viral defense system
MSEIAGIGKSYRLKLSKVLEMNTGVITTNVVSNILSVSLQEAGRLLSRWCKSGWVMRIKQGAYIPVPLDSTVKKVIPEEPFLIVDELYGPGYIAGFSAIKHWDFTEQIIESVTYFTSRNVKKRNITLGGINYKLKTISKQKMFGLKTIWIGSKKIKVSDPTKTIIDLFDDPKLVGGMSIVSDIVTDYLDSEYYDINLLIEYAKEMKNKTIFKRLGFLLETRFDVHENNISLILNNTSSGLSDFDPTISSNHINSKWNLKVSASWKQEYDRKK